MSCEGFRSLVTAYVDGELDLATVPELEKLLADVDLGERLVIDLSPCTFLDSSAVRVLITTIRDAGERGGPHSARPSLPFEASRIWRPGRRFCRALISFLRRARSCLYQRYPFRAAFFPRSKLGHCSNKRTALLSDRSPEPSERIRRNGRGIRLN